MIYFIGNDDYIKIGYSKNLNTINKRLPSLQTGCPFVIDLFLVINGDIKKEKELHSTFKNYLTSGEWFLNSSEIKNFIEESKKNSLITKENLNCRNITLKDLRKSKNYSLREIGEKINMTPQSVKETEDRFLDESITIKSLKKYAKAIDCDVEIKFIFNIENEK
jgi:DNA-binding XRE family transcriptional regulator